MQYVLNLKALKYITADIFWYIMLIYPQCDETRILDLSWET